MRAATQCAIFLLQCVYCRREQQKRPGTYPENRDSSLEKGSVVEVENTCWGNSNKDMNALPRQQLVRPGARVHSFR